MCGFTCPAQFFVIYCLDDHWNDIINVKNDTEGQSVAQNTDSMQKDCNLITIVTLKHAFISKIVGNHEGFWEDKRSSTYTHLKKKQ